MDSLLNLHRRLVRQGPNGFLEKGISLLLAPLGWLYGAISLCRYQLYRRRLLPIHRAPVPVVSIGNLAVGGTGKTPVVDYVVKYLLACGRRVAIVSRGYGGSQTGVGVVSAGTGPLLPPELSGDEPYLLALRNPGALVLVAPRRREGIRLAVEKFGAEAIVLDDGFQHLAVARDLDIVLLDARAPFGNGHVLPGGLLREFPSALRRAGIFILTRCGESLPADISLPGPALHSRHRLEGKAVALDGQQTLLAELSGKTGFAFAGIADPDAFFQDLATAGLTLRETVAFTDHAAYGPAEIAILTQSAAFADYLITTEKDAVKLQGKSFPVPCYQVPLTVEIIEAAELQQALQEIFANGGENERITRAS